MTQTAPAHMLEALGKVQVPGHEQSTGTAEAQLEDDELVLDVDEVPPPPDDDTPLLSDDVTPPPPPDGSVP